MLTRSLGALKWVANIHMLYTLAAPNNMTLVGDDSLKSDLPERTFITTLSCTIPSMS